MQTVLPTPRRALTGASPRLLLLVDSVLENYQATIVLSAAQAAIDRGATLRVLVAGELDHEPHKNHLYDLVASDASRAGRPIADAIIVLAGTVANRVGSAGLEGLARRIGDVPVVAVGGAVGQGVRVQVDDGSGVKEVVRHLIEVHGHRRIGFIRGPRHNAEAERRYGAYQEALQAAGIEVPEELVLEGAFHWDDGVELAAELLDRRRVHLADVDAIVGASDYMVLGLLEELVRRGHRAPDDVALAGFDDVEEGHWGTPPLTTARQPLEQLGKEAVRLALEQLRVATVEDIALPTPAVVRRSCGCLPELDDGGPGPREAPAGLGLRSGLLRRRELIVAALSRAARGTLTHIGRDWEPRLLGSVSDYLTLGDRSRFLELFDGMLRNTVLAGGSLDVFHDLVTVLRSELLRAGPTASERDALERLMHAARLSVSTGLERAQGRRRLLAEQSAQALSRAGIAIVGSQSFTELAGNLAAALPDVGVEGCSVLLYEGAVSGEGGDSASGRQRLQAVARSRQGAVVDHHAEFVHTHQFAPEDASGQASEGTWSVVEPIHAGPSPLGYVVFDPGHAPLHAMASLRQSIGAAVQAILLRQEARHRGRATSPGLPAFHDDESPTQVTATEPGADEDAPSGRTTLIDPVDPSS